MNTENIAAMIQLSGQVEIFTEQMNNLKTLYSGDPEMFHRHADQLMMDTLSELGFSEGVSIFNESEKWYA